MEVKLKVKYEKIMFEKPKERSYTWTCFLCEKEYPNTLRYCPHCDIAKKHSDNLRKSAKKKRKKKKN